MKSIIGPNGQTVIPPEIRQRFNLTKGDKLDWIVEDDTIQVIPIRTDPIAPFRGSGTGGSTKRLIKDRTQE